MTPAGTCSKPARRARADRSPDRKRAVAVLLGAAFVDSLSYSLALPLLPAILGLYGGGAATAGLLVAVHAAMAAIASPVLGRAADRWGHRRVILLSVVGLAVSCLMFALAPGLSWLFAARAIAGAMAGNLGVIQAAIACRYLPDQKPAAMAHVSAAWAFGFVLGPALAAAKPAGLNPASWAGGIAAAACLVVAVLAAFWLNNRPAAAGPGPDTAASIKPSPIVRRHTALILLGLIAFCQTGLVAMTGFWCSHIFGWNERAVSLLFLWVAFCIILSQLFGVRAIQTKVSSRSALTLALLTILIACMTVALLPRSEFALILAAPALLVGIATSQALLTATLSDLAANKDQGRALGAANGLAALCRIMAPPLFGALFSLVAPIAVYYLVLTLSGAMILALLVDGARRGERDPAARA